MSTIEYTSLSKKVKLSQKVAGVKSIGVSFMHRSTHIKCAEV